ncbi:MAG: aryl-sulfate sulfotransferase [Bacteroidota bacterium]
MLIRFRALGFPRLLTLLLLVSACDQAEPDPEPVEAGLDFVTALAVTLNPTGVAPLAAEVAVTTTQPTSVEVRIAGRGPTGIPLQHRFDDLAQTHALPVLGLYAATENAVTLRFFDANGAVLGDTTVTVTTDRVGDAMPQIFIDVPASGGRPGLNLVSYFGHNGDVVPQRPFMFDATGATRWLLDFTDDPVLGNLFYDNGIERLANGNLYFGSNSTSLIYEMTMLGEIVRTWDMPGFSFHHNVIEKPDGNFIATVNKVGLGTIEDHVIEIDRESGAIVTVWDLNQSLDNRRRAWPSDFADLEVDWFHGNALAYDADDDAILVSGRTQGVVKLTRDNEVVWILAPHRGWNTSGDGTNLRRKLLQPLDASGQPITDGAVLDGATPHPDFEWAWYQHAPTLLPDGTLALFDNGDSRHYLPDGQGPRYSRAVLYDIDDDARTIQQVWQYGKERGTDTFSRIVSDVDIHPEVDRVMFMPGAVIDTGTPYGKMVEVDRASGAVRFEVTIVPPQPAFGFITFHRIERIPLYP